MKELSDQEFHRLLDAVERKEALPPDLPADDNADLEFAERLFALRPVLRRADYPVAGRSRTPRAALQHGLVWRFAAVVLLALALLAAFALGRSGTANAEIFGSPGLAEDMAWISPIPVIFEGERYEPAAFQVLYEEELRDVELVLVLDGDENDLPIFRAFRSREDARLFLDERQGAPLHDELPKANK